ncbi:MAG: PAS domain-containing protein [Longimicrobiales bacterium]
MTSIDKNSVIYVSPSHERIWGRPREPLAEHPKQWLEAIHPDDRDRVVAALPKQVEGTYDEEYRVVRPDGEIRWVRDRAFPVRDETGRPYRVAGVAEDVTDRRLRGKELQLLSSAIEHTGEGVVITDPSGAIEYVNPAFEEITGYSRSEVLGKNPRILKSGKQKEAFYRPMWETPLDGRAWRARFINRRKDGAAYTQDSVIPPVHSDNGEITHFVAAFRDVTNELALEEQLRQSQKLEAVGRLAGGIAHDFNDVLTIITGRAQFALEDLAGDEPLAHDIQEILSAADRAQRLSRQLLAFSRQQVTRPEVLDIGSVARDAESMLRRLLGEHLELQVSVSADPGRIKADRTQIEQVLINLAINARDAMPGGGTLTIETENVRLDADDPGGFPDPVRAGEYVRVRVADTRTGMDEETRENAFDPFYTTKPRGLGTGLGLSTVYGIVRQNNARIQVESEPGQGTTFEIYLPTTDEAPKGTALRDSRDALVEGEQEPVGSGTILVVEDQPGVRSMVRRSLERASYRVLEAEHGVEALDVCAGESGVDLVLTDMVMPQMGRVGARETGSRGAGGRSEGWRRRIKEAVLSRDKARVPAPKA